MYPSLYDPTVTQTALERIERLGPETRAGWGKMSVDQMLAHLNVAYDMETGALPVSNNFLMRFILKTFVKKAVVGPKPYPKNGRTAPAFVISDRRNFEQEKAKLMNHMNRFRRNGAAHYEGKENVSFGKLTASEWNVLYYKHLDHHLQQFGV